MYGRMDELAAFLDFKFGRLGRFLELLIRLRCFACLERLVAVIFVTPAARQGLQVVVVFAPSKSSSTQELRGMSSRGRFVGLRGAKSEEKSLRR